MNATIHQQKNLMMAISALLLIIETTETNVLLFGVLNGTVHLASGMFIHQASVLFVILNAMRLIRFHRKDKKVERQLQVTPASFLANALHGKKGDL